MPHPKICDGHCQALRRVTVISGLPWLAVALAVTCPAPSDRLIVMIHITDTIAIEEREVEESFVRAAGPGGQNVNKVATAVQLRFDIRRSPSLPDDVRARLEKLAGRRLTQEGVLIITAQRYRTQERNRQDGLERLVALLRRAAVRPRRGDPRSRPPAPGGVAWRPRGAALASRSCGRLRPPSSRTRDPPRTLSSQGIAGLRRQHPQRRH
jgi:ribosome-associated protein